MSYSTLILLNLLAVNVVLISQHGAWRGGRRGTDPQAQGAILGH